MEIKPTEIRTAQIKDDYESSCVDRPMIVVGEVEARPSSWEWDPQASGRLHIS